MSNTLLLKIFNGLLCFTILISMEACIVEEECISGQVDLVVHVTGTFSGKNRSNIEVRLYLTEEDADAAINDVNISLITDENGNVYFYDIEGGRSYWVRADTLLLHSTRQTNVLKVGTNHLEIRVI